MKEVIKNVLLGTVVFVVGFAIIFVLTSSDIEAELTYYAGIAFALLYLASVIFVCTALLLKKMTHESAFNLEEAQKIGLTDILKDMKSMVLDFGLLY